MKVVFFSSRKYEKEAFKEINTKHQIIYNDYPLNESTVYSADTADAVCIFVDDELNQRCIEKLSKLGVKIIALRCAGYDNIDLIACANHDILVVRVPAYSPHAVAEHAIALLLTLNRKTHKAYNRVREGNFSIENLMGFNLHDKTVGVVGLGNIGMIFSEICHGFGCNVLASDPVINKCNHATLVSFNRLIEESHIISLHCPLTDDSYHIINDVAINNMKKGIVLLNTGRGALIDTEALTKGLKSQKIGAVGLDVYEEERGLFFGDHSDEIIQDDILMRLMTFPNVLITGHQGFFTQEALHEIAVTTLNNLSEIESTGTCINKVIS